MPGLTDEDEALLEKRRGSFTAIYEERIPCLKGLVEDLDLGKPDLVETHVGAFVPLVDNWLIEYSKTGEDARWLAAPLAYLIGECLSQRYQGEWFLCEERDSSHFAKIVVGRFKEMKDSDLMIDPFEYAREVLGYLPGITIAQALAAAEADLTSGVTEVVRNLIREGLNHALSCLNGSDDLVPFLMTIDLNGDRKLDRFLSTDMVKDIESARQEADRQRDWLRAWVVVYDNFVRTPDGRFEAVSCEAGENGLWLPYQWAQCYSRAEGIDQVELIGDTLCGKLERNVRAG